MTFDRYSQRRRAARNRLVLIAALIAAAGLGAGIFAVLTGASDSDESEAKGSKHTSAPPSSSVPPTSGSTKPTVLPKPRGVKNGVPVGYPHTTAGAVSALSHFYDVLDLFSPEAVEKQGRVIAEPQQKDFVGWGLRDSSQKIRKHYKLPAEGESDDGTYYTNNSRAYQIRGAGSNKITVWVLSDVEYSVRGVSQTYTEVTGNVMVWADGDWKISEWDDPAGKEPAKATPDSAKAAKAGWRTLVYEK